MTTEFGARLRLTSTLEVVCDGLLTVHRWKLVVESDEHIRQLAVAVGRSYITDQALLATPRASVSSKVPKQPKVRSGDFGEMIAIGIYSTRMGRNVPYSKLMLGKPVANATVQGPDTVCLSINPGDDDEPVVVEAKTRVSGQPSAVLPAIADSVGVLDEEYLVSAWAAGAQLMLSHPDYQRSFALAAAQHLGRLLDPDASLPPHKRHAVAIVGQDMVTKAKIDHRWGDAPPVTELHIVVVDDLDGVRDRIFQAAAGLSYDDLTAGAGSLVGPSKRAGIAGLISRDVPERLADLRARDPLRIVVEASLWYLANEDGIAHARAAIGTRHVDSDAKGLSQLLTGALAGACGTLAGRELEKFAKIARRVVDREDDESRLRDAVDQLQCEDALKHAAGHVAAALLHRLERHPTTMTVTKGATGSTVQHVVDTMRRYGKHAFWPSQAEAIRGGLLDPGQRSLAIKMPTSAGKTTLMQLVIADTIDSSSDAVVAVLAPTRALVGQLYRDLRDGLPKSVAIRSSQGGLDYDTELPSASAVLAGPGVAVVTPERFDLDWRRAATGDGGIDLDAIELLVVDEAQHINNGGRGATLEKVIAKALRRNIRVVLLASQFHDVHAIANWVNGTALESDWQPAWLERHVYTRGLTQGQEGRTRTGYLWPEGSDPVEILTLKPSGRSKGDGWIRDRKHEAAGLVAEWVDDGLVVVFTATKAYADGLLQGITAGLDGQWTPDPRLVELAKSIEDVHPNEAAALSLGFGLHTADAPRAVRLAIESAARQGAGLLRCIVCTPTLLEGVDFPTRTVIAAYPPRTATHEPDIARLRNLEGRAGRAGRFTSGRLVVMTSDHTQARRWRRAMREQLPPTETALTLALRKLQSARPEWMTGEERDIIDAIALEALAESGVADGQLRGALEDALQRTYWSATSPPDRQDRAVTNGADYVALVAQRVPDAALRNAFHRSGLNLLGLLQLRDAIAGKLSAVVGVLRAIPPDPEKSSRLLHWLIWQCVSHLPELEGLRDTDSTTLMAALDAWIDGLPEDDIEQAYPDAWAAVTPNHRETLFPWALTGAFEIIAALAGDLQLREVAHKRLEPVRLRYGVPHGELGDLARDGYDRVRVARVARDCLAETSGHSVTYWALSDVVRHRIDEADAADADATADDEINPDDVAF